MSASPSPWLDSSTAVTNSNGSDIDPWSDLLQPSSSSSSQQLRSRKSSPSSLPHFTTASTSSDPWSLTSNTDYLTPHLSPKIFARENPHLPFPQLRHLRWLIGTLCAHLLPASKVGVGDLSKTKGHGREQYHGDHRQLRPNGKPSVQA